MTGSGRGTEPEALGHAWADLVALVVFTALTNFVVLTSVADSVPAKEVLGVTFVLLVPGYGLLAALFPEGDASVRIRVPGEKMPTEETDGQSIDALERFALSIGLSVAVVPLLAIGLETAAYPIRPETVIPSATAVTVVATAIGAFRRWRLPSDERFRASYRSYMSTSFLPSNESTADTILNGLLVLSIVVALGSVGFAVSAPSDGDTDFYLLAANESGEYTADEYPSELTTSEQTSLLVGINNREHNAVEYTVVALIQRVSDTDGSASVTSYRVHSRNTARVAHNETWQQVYELSPTGNPDRVRFMFLLYRSDPPSNPTMENAYRETHLWVNVTSGDASR